MASKKLCEGTILATKKPCTRPQTENGFCKTHQAQVFLRDAKEKGEQVCRRFDHGCRKYLTAEEKASGLKTCSPCRADLSGKSKPCEHKGCPNNTNGTNRFCGKHARDIFREKEKKGTITYCDINRGCASVLQPGEKVCEKCINEKDERVTKEIKQIRDNLTNCLKCKVGEKDKDSYFCTACLHLINVIVYKNVKRDLNDVWRDFKNGAIKRDYELTVNFEAFKDIVVRPCFFCGEFSLSSYNGIDRYDNRKGYISSNCVPCCSQCNIMKGSTQPIEFYEKIQAILHYQTHSVSQITDLLEKYPSLATKSKKSYTYYKKRTISVRHIQFELTKEQYDRFHEGVCYLCGVGTRKDYSNGIDRVDSNKGYTVENCRTCCGHCNLMKNSYDLGKFLQKCKQIVAFWKPIIEEVAKPAKTEPTVVTTECAEPTEIYRATDVYEILQRGIPEFLAWARKMGKSEQFMNGVRSIEFTEKPEIVKEIQHQMELERKRTNPAEKSHIQASTMLSMLMNSPKSTFVNLYSSMYELSNSFDSKLDELIGQLAIVGNEEGKELCKKFLRAESMRRKSKRNTEVCKELREVPMRAEWTAKPLCNMVVCDPIKHEVLKEKVVEPLTNEIVCYPINQDTIKNPEIEGVCESKVNVPKQWKIRDIYEDIKTNNGCNYKAYCESNNTLDSDTWSTSWTKLMEIKTTPFESVKDTITAFVHDLRRKRHNQLTDKKVKGTLLERGDRAAWPLTTILFAFKQEKIIGFKQFMEELNAGRVKAWETKWSTFVSKVENASDDDSKKDIISKFLTNMRTARYVGTPKS